MAKELTAAQKQQLETFKAEAVRIGHCTDPADLAPLIDVWPKLYRRAGHAPPEFVCLMPGPVASRVMLTLWAEYTPLEILNVTIKHPTNPNFNTLFHEYLLKSLTMGGHPTKAEGRKRNFDIKDAKPLPSTWFWGQHEAYWLMYYRAAEAVGVEFTAEQLERLAEYEVTVRNSLCAWPNENGVVICDRPLTLNSELVQQSQRYQLHAPDKPAVLYRDGSRVYAWHGISVDERIIMQPETLTVKDINAERNAEVRRVMLEKMGLERYLNEGKFEVIDRSDYGTLYRETNPPPGSQEPAVLLKVINSTKEPDGTYKNYVFSVPPTMQRARQALAWQYNMEEKDYEPVIET